MPKFKKSAAIALTLLLTLAVLPSFMVVNAITLYGTDTSGTSDEDLAAESGPTTTSDEVTTSDSSLQTLRDTFKANRELRTAEREQRIADLRAQTAAVRCQTVTTNIQNRLNYYNANYDSQVARYTSLAEKVANALERLQALGFDITELDSKLTELNSLIRQWNDTRTNFISALTLSQDLACGTSDGDFKAQLLTATDLLKDLREQGAEIKAFVQDELKTAITAVKEQSATDTN